MKGEGGDGPRKASYKGLKLHYVWGGGRAGAGAGAGAGRLQGQCWRCGIWCHWCYGNRVESGRLAMVGSEKANGIPGALKFFGEYRTPPKKNAAFAQDVDPFPFNSTCPNLMLACPPASKASSFLKESSRGIGAEPKGDIWVLYAFKRRKKNHRSGGP